MTAFSASFLAGADDDLKEEGTRKRKMKDEAESDEEEEVEGKEVRRNSSG